MITTDVPVTTCLACGELIDIATHLEKAPPESGDISFCLMCGNIARFADDLTLRKLTDDERTVIESDPRVIVMRKVHRKTMKRHRQ